MAKLGYKTYLWGAAHKDWETNNQPSNEAAMQALRKYTSSGDVILLHTVSQTNVTILPSYIDEYRQKGLVFSLPE